MSFDPKLAQKELEDLNCIIQDYYTATCAVMFKYRTVDPYDLFLYSCGHSLTLLPIAENLEGMPNTRVTIIEKETAVFEQVKEILTTGNRFIDLHNGGCDKLARIIGGLSYGRTHNGMLLLDLNGLVDWSFLAELFSLRNKHLFRFEVAIHFSATTHKRHLDEKISECAASISKSKWFCTEMYRGRHQWLTLVGTQWDRNPTSGVLYPISLENGKWVMCRADNTVKQLAELQEENEQ